MSEAGQTPSAGPDLVVWTIGHSNHPLEKLLGLVEEQQIGVLVDVRSSPYSKYASHFDRESLQEALRTRNVQYLFLGDQLGGRPEGDEFYDKEGYVRYDRLAQSPGFQQGAERLLRGIASHRVAIVCGEEDPTHCHRRLLLGRVLGRRGVRVLHIRGDGRVQSEEELAAEEEFHKTKGQLSLFDTEDTEAWRSTQSVSPRKAPPSSSAHSASVESAD
jgi:uncharacterized protein (DUF488 family)